MLSVSYSIIYRTSCFKVYAADIMMISCNGWSINLPFVRGLHCLPVVFPHKHFMSYGVPWTATKPNNIITVCWRTTAWASYQIRKIAGAHAPGMPGTFSSSPQVSDPDMHHGTCVTHVPWCMPGSLTNGFLWNRRRGETFPAFPAHAQPAILRIW